MARRSVDGEGPDDAAPFPATRPTAETATLSGGMESALGAVSDMG